MKRIFEIDWPEDMEADGITADGLARALERLALAVRVRDVTADVAALGYPIGGTTLKRQFHDSIVGIARLFAELTSRE